MIPEIEEIREAVTAKEREIEAEIAQLKAVCGFAQEKICELETKLSQVRAVVHNDWEEVTRAGAITLCEWLRRS